jgi:hypothetical protein
MHLPIGAVVWAALALAMLGIFGTYAACQIHYRLKNGTKHELLR